MRLCIFITARCGSSFVREVLGTSGPDCFWDIGPQPMQSSPEAYHLLEDSIPGKYVPVDYITKTPIVDRPEVYTFYVPTEADKNYLDTFFPGEKDSWRFAYLIRDPRNRIVSYLNWHPKDALDRDKRFETIINAIKVSTKGILEMLEDNRFRLFRFEDLIISPITELQKMLGLIEVVLDNEFYEKRVQDWLSERINSSFEDKGKRANLRWASLPEEEKKLIHSLIGEELIQLGYVADDSWTKLKLVDLLPR